MTKRTIVAALRLILSLAIAGPAQAWPGQSSDIDCTGSSEQMECDVLTATLVRKHAHPHIRRTEHAALPLAPTPRPDRDEDPLASMHFE